MEGLWFIALSTATSRTCALACRMNTALSVLSIRHHHLSPPLPLSLSRTHTSHFMPQYINNLSLFWYLLLHICFLPRNPGPQFYVSHYFDALAWVVHLGIIAKKVDISIDFSSLWESKPVPCVSHSLAFTFWAIELTFLLHKNPCWLKKISFFSFKDGLCNITFHSHSHAACLAIVNCMALATGKVVLQVIMAVFCCCF